MSTVEEIDDAIRKLPPKEFSEILRKVIQRQHEIELAYQETLPQAGAAPESYVQQAKWNATEEWLAAFEAWLDGNKHITTSADDSRESIYAGRGE